MGYPKILPQYHAWQGGDCRLMIKSAFQMAFGNAHPTKNSLLSMVQDLSYPNTVKVQLKPFKI